MPRVRYQLPLRVFLVPHQDPKTPEQIEANQRPALLESEQTVVEGRNVDVLLRETHRLLEDRGHAIRNLGMGRGEVVAYVFRPEESRSDTRTVKESRRRYA